MLIDTHAVLFDLDGTAVPSGFEGRPTPALKQAIKHARASGLHMCAATGRSWDVAEHLLKELALTDPCIIAGGTQIIDSRTWQLVWRTPISPESAHHIARVAADHNYLIEYSQGLETKLDQDPNQLRSFENIDIVYLLGVPNAQAPILTKALASDAGITVAWADSWKLPGKGVDLHITNSSATKEYAVHELAKLIDVPVAHMAGVGDGLNDLHLFNAVGHKVAMGNAVPELKAAADEVIGTVDKDGLAVYIKSLVQSH